MASVLEKKETKEFKEFKECEESELKESKERAEFSQGENLVGANSEFQIILPKEQALLDILQAGTDNFSEFQFFLIENFKFISESFLVTVLFEAVKRNKIEEVEYLLYRGVLVDSRDDQNNTPLIFACGHEKTSVEMIEVLLNSGASLTLENNGCNTAYLNAVKYNRKETFTYLKDKYPELPHKTSPEGKTVFMAAAEGGQIHIMEEELAKNKKIWKQTLRGRYNAFMAAAYGNSVSAMKFLLRLDPKFHEKRCENGWTPLMSAAKNGSLDAIQLLFDMIDRKNIGKMIKNVTNKNETAFLIAAYGHVSAMALLLEYEPEAYKINKKGGVTPFIAACQNGSIPAMKFMLHQDLDCYKHLRTDSGTGPFIEAACGGKIAAMDYLRQINKDFPSQNSKSGWSAILAAAGQGNVNGIRYLLHINPMWINYADNNGFIPLHIAAFNGHLSAVRFLLSQGSKIQYQSNQGKHEEHFASDKNHTQVVEHLKEVYTIVQNVKDGKINLIQSLQEKGHTLYFRTGDSNSLLHIALLSGQTETVFYLLDEGVQKEWVNDNNETACDLAFNKNAFTVLIDLVKQGDLNHIKKLIVSSDSLYYRDNRGNSLLHHALEHNQLEVAVYLLEQGVLEDWKNRWNENAFKYAVKRGRLNIVVDLFNKMASKIIRNDALEEEEKEKLLQNMREELESLIELAKEYEHKHPIDYEYLAQHYHRKYWLDWADKVECSHISSYGNEKYKYYEDKEKLSQNIFNKIIQCVEDDEDGGNSVSYKLYESEQNDRLETEDEKFIRLKWSLIFAMQSEKKQLIMQIILSAFKGKGINLEYELKVLAGMNQDDNIGKAPHFHILECIIKLFLKINPEIRETFETELLQKYRVEKLLPKYLPNENGLDKEKLIELFKFLVSEEIIRKWAKRNTEREQQKLKDLQLAATRKILALLTKPSAGQSFIHEIITMLDNLIKVMEEIECDIDYEYIALNYHPRYWASWVNKCKNEENQDRKVLLKIAELIYCKLVLFNSDPENILASFVSPNFVLVNSELECHPFSVGDSKSRSETQRLFIEQQDPVRFNDKETKADVESEMVDKDIKRIVITIALSPKRDNLASRVLFSLYDPTLSKEEIYYINKRVHDLTDLLVKLLELQILPRKILKPLPAVVGLSLDEDTPQIKPLVFSREMGEKDWIASPKVSHDKEKDLQLLPDDTPPHDFSIFKQN